MLQEKMEEPVSAPPSPRDVNKDDTAANLTLHVQHLRSQVAELKMLLLNVQQDSLQPPPTPNRWALFNKLEAMAGQEIDSLEARRVNLHEQHVKSLQSLLKQMANSLEALCEQKDKSLKDLCKLKEESLEALYEQKKSLGNQYEHQEEELKAMFEHQEKSIRALYEQQVKSLEALHKQEKSLEARIHCQHEKWKEGLEIFRMQRENKIKNLRELREEIDALYKQTKGLEKLCKIKEGGTESLFETSMRGHAKLLEQEEKSLEDEIRYLLEEWENILKTLHEHREMSFKNLHEQWDMSFKTLCMQQEKGLKAMCEQQENSLEARI